MKKLLSSLAFLAVLGACSSVPPEPDSAPYPGPVPGVAPEPPGQVPPLASLPETPARALQGRYVQVSWDAVPGWHDDDMQQVWKVLLHNCGGLMRPVSGSLALPARAAPRAWQPFCQALVQSGINEHSSAAGLRQFLQSSLRPWRLENPSGGPATGTATGYYEPLIQAALTRQGEFQWPLYAVPDDLLIIDLAAVYPELAGKRVRGKLQGRTVVPYDTRAQIEADRGRQPAVVAWAGDPVEAFFLQIQGSGRAVLPDGSTIRLAYADHNGRPYVSIAQWLARQGEIELAQASMQNIKAWARRNPARVRQLLDVNPAMVFFRAESISDPGLGPKGSYGVPLVAQRSIAADPDFVPLGTPVFLSTHMPGGSAPLRRLVFAQDTGAAIKGAGRADYYWGTGDEAGAMAGRMKQPAQMWLLWPAGAGAPSAR